MCASQRSGDYDKWKWFDLCLWWGIRKLSLREKNSFPVYSGLNGVKLNKKCVKRGFFVTYVSTSWQKEVSIAFMNGSASEQAKKGMIIKFHGNYGGSRWINCCDVSWISKFPDECEILFARGLRLASNDKYGNNFKCKVLDESDGIQTILLNKPGEKHWRNL